MNPDDWKEFILNLDLLVLNKKTRDGFFIQLQMEFQQDFGMDLYLVGIHKMGNTRLLNWIEKRAMELYKERKYGK